MSVDAKLDALLNDPQTPDGLKADLLKAALERDTARAAQDHETRRAKWSTPLIIALTGLITMAGNLGVGYFTGVYETSNAVTLDTLQSELDRRATEQTAQLTQELETLKAELAEKASNAAALQQLRAKEREFQYKILEQQLALASADTSVPEEVLAQRRAKVLLFLVEIDALSELNPEKLRSYAEAGNVPALVSTQPARPSADDNIEMMGKIRVAPVEDYPALFERHRGDELMLGTLGKAAFRNEKYDWVIKALEQARLVQSSKVWQSGYPFLIGTYMLTGETDKVSAATEEMFREIDAEYGYLTWPSQLGRLLSDFGDVRALEGMDATKRALISGTMDRIEEALAERGSGNN